MDLLRTRWIVVSTGRAQTAVVTRNVNLRTGPSSSRAIVRHLAPPDELTIIDLQLRNGYYEIRTAGGDHGWVWGQNVHITAGTVITTPVTAPAAGLSDVYRGCPLEGSAMQARRQASNQKKNRLTAAMASDVDPAVTIGAVMQDGADENRWSDGRAGSVVVYVVDVKKGGEETVNCGETDVRYRDTHIDVVANPNDTRKIVRMIVEVTPRWRTFRDSQGEDWSTDALKQRLKNHWVRFSGWLFWDFEHSDEAEHTNPGRAANWRATAWEIHPVTDIKVCPGAPESCD